MFVGGIGVELSEVLVRGHLVSIYAHLGSGAGVARGAICIENKGDVALGPRFGREVVVDAVEDLFLSIIVEAVIASLVGSHRLGDGLAIFAGGADVVFDGNQRIAHERHSVDKVEGVDIIGVDVAESGVDGDNGVNYDGVDRGDGIGMDEGTVQFGVGNIVCVNYALVDGSSGQNTGELVAVPIETECVPFAAIDTVDGLSMVDSAAVGDNGTNRDVVATHGVGRANDGFVQDADGVIGRNLLGDTVDGTARAVELTHVNWVDGVARIGSLQLFNIGTVPSCAGLSVDNLREARLQD